MTPSDTPAVPVPRGEKQENNRPCPKTLEKRALPNY